MPPTTLPGRTALRLAILLMRSAGQVIPSADGTVVVPLDQTAAARLLNIHIKTVGKCLWTLEDHGAIRLGTHVRDADRRRSRHTVTMVPSSWVWAAARSLHEDAETDRTEAIRDETDALGAR